MGYTVKINKAKLRQLSRAAVIALEETAEALHTEVVQAEVMPFDVGTMQNESTFVDTAESATGSVSLVTSTAYARRLYYHPEYNFRTSENEHAQGKKRNKNAQGKWLEPWIDGDKKDFCKEAFKKLYRGEAGL